MDTNKHVWYLVISLMPLLTMSCNSNQEKVNSEGVLFECILDAFLKESSSGKDEFIYAYEMQNWNDTASVITFHYSDISPNALADSLNTRISDYKNFKVVHIRGSLNQIPNNDYWIPSHLEWKEITEDKQAITHSNLNFSQDEFQIIYDSKNKKIHHVLKSFTRSKAEIIENLKNCK